VAYSVPVNGILSDVEGSSAGNTDNTRDNTSDDGDGDGVDNALVELRNSGGSPVGLVRVRVRPGRDGSGSASEESGSELELHFERGLVGDSASEIGWIVRGCCSDD
jgi:hypothetical protein